MLILKLAFRNIFRQRRRSLLTVLSMSGGFVLYALIISVEEGSYNNAVNFFTQDHTGHIQIHKGNYRKRPKIYTTIDHPAQLSALLDANDRIHGHTFRVHAPALAYSETDNSPVQVIGVDLERDKTTSRLADKVAEGEYFDSGVSPEGYHSAMIGAGVSNNLDITIGDEIILLSQGADGSIANDLFIVAAIIGNKDSHDKGSVFLPLKSAQDFLGMYGRVHEVSILLKDDTKARSMSASIQEQIPDLTVEPWQIVESTFYKSMIADKEGANFMMTIIVFIVFIGVLNTVLMSVLERTREFGVLKAVGTRPRTIAWLITLETSLLSIISISIGLVISIPVTGWLTFVGFELPEPLDVGGISMSHMQGEMSFIVFSLPAITIFIFALLISIPTGLRAARILPTEAMGSH